MNWEFQGDFLLTAKVNHVPGLGAAADPVLAEPTPPSENVTVPQDNAHLPGESLLQVAEKERKRRAD